MAYNGDNTGTQKIQYGAFKGKNYEWRFLGYASNGGAIGNPYFPSDVSDPQMNGKSAYQVDMIFASYYWVLQSWKNSYFTNLFGQPQYSLQQREQWVGEYLLPQHPGFKAEAIARLKAQHSGTTTWDLEYYWAMRLMPLSDPSKSSTAWVGWHNEGQGLYYHEAITNPPAQPNMRLVDYQVYDSKNNLIAEETRGTDPINDNPTIKYYSNTVTKGATYHIVAKVENMPQAKNNITNTPITLNEMYSFDSDVGLTTKYTVEKDNADTAQSPYSNNLPSGATAVFKYNYTVPTTSVPKQQVEFAAGIPDSFYANYDNMDRQDGWRKGICLAKQLHR